MPVQEAKPSFSNLQLELLKLYANDVSDEQLLEIKWLLGKYFTAKASGAMDAVISEKKFNTAKHTAKNYRTPPPGKS